ncbi:MAG: hypothetical protein FWD94_04115 [Treponema sp.]|nr:hypothetical protein [Treponema sp.]
MKRVYYFKRIFDKHPVLHIFGIKDTAIRLKRGGNNNSVKDLKIVLSDQALSEFYRGENDGLDGTPFQPQGAERKVVRKLQFQNNFLLKTHFCRALARKNARIVRKPTGFPNKSNH